MIGGQKKIVFWWSKGKKGRKCTSKGKNTFSGGDSRTLHQGKGSDKDLQPNKGKSKDQRRKGKESSYSQSGRSASESPSEEGYGHSWESDDWYSSVTDSSCATVDWYGTGHAAWIAAIPLNLSNHLTHVVLDLSCTRSLGSRSAIGRFQSVALWHYHRALPLQQVLCVCQLCDGDLLGKLYYSLSNETSMFDQSWCAWNR